MNSSLPQLKFKINEKEYEIIELNKLLEIEKNKNKINNEIIKDKDVEINNLNKIFKVFEEIISSIDKISKNCINNKLKIIF